MCYDNSINLLPKDLLIDIVERLSYLDDYYRFSAVCKSWNSAAAATEKPWWLPTRIPMLLLAEDVAPGSILFDTELDFKNKDDGDGDDAIQTCYDYTSLGLYSLSTMKTYNIELPEAAGKLILTTSKGWLLTVDRDSQINLLHPPSRYQFSLPPMVTFPIPPEDLEDYDPRDNRKFISKVAMSSKLLKGTTDVSFFHQHTTPLPIVMAVHEKSGSLGFARLGDKVWTDAQVPSDIRDIVYHKGNFFALDFQGDVFVCCIDSDEEKGGPRGTKIASIDPLVVHEQDMDLKMYLVEPFSGSGLLLIVRYIKMKYFDTYRGKQRYRTTKFSVWRLDLNYNDSLEIPSCTLTKEKNLGNEAIFVGRASSFSVSSSDIIKANSVYFTDDYRESYLYIGGGHDNGIFDMERRTIEPHFQRKSIHCISPPLWYI